MEVVFGEDLNETELCEECVQLCVAVILTASLTPVSITRM